MRGGQWDPGLDETDDAAATTQPAPEEEDDPEYRLHAYYGFDYGGADDINGREAAAFDTPNAGKRIDILILGGSVAAGFAKDAHRLLEQELSAFPEWGGRKVKVQNAARGGFRQPQLLHLLEYLLAVGYEPDIVIEIDGFNEVALGLQNARAGVHPVMPSVSHWRHLASTETLGSRAIDAIATVRNEQNGAQRLFERADGFGLFHSAIATRIVQTKLEQSYARYAAAASAYEQDRANPNQRSYLIGPPFDRADDNALEISARLWFEGSFQMDAICRAWGIRYVHFLQPTLHDEGSKPTTQTERTKGAEPQEWATGAKLGYPKLRARGAELVARGVEFHDLSRAFADVSEDLYYDVCHFAPVGNRMLAEPVIEVLKQRVPPERPESR